MTRMLRPIGTLFDRIFCLGLAVLLAQFPVYLNQYIDVLSGAQQEAETTFRDLEQAAASFQLRVDEYLQRLQENADPMVQANAEVSMRVVERYRRYTEALGDLTTTSVWGRPFALAKHYDPAIHSAMHFEPNIPLTWEGAIYALLGLLLALGLIGLVKWLGRRLQPQKDPIVAYGRGGKPKA